MNHTTNANQPKQRKKYVSAPFWIVITILLVSVLGSQFIPASSAYTPANGDMPGKKGLFADSTATATSTRKPTATKTPTAASTKTPKISATPAASIQIIGGGVSLRTSPSVMNAVIRMLRHNEQVQIFGQSSDGEWYYVRTAEGEEGWIMMSWVGEVGEDVKEDLPVKTPSPAPPPTVKLNQNLVVLRTGPGTHFSSINTYDFGEELLLLGRLNDNSWLYVETSDGREGWVHWSVVNLGKVNLMHEDYPIKTPPPTETATLTVLDDIEGHWIDIDLSEQTLRAYDGTQLIDSFLVSTGVSRFPTQAGKFKIYAKFPKILMAGFDYYLPDVPHSMFYDGDFSIHGTYWHHNFGTPMSHGCVNMDKDDAKWLYEFAPIGTVVNIHY